MKERLTAALALLNSAASDIRPGGRGEIDFKQALVEIQGVIDAPEPEPKTVVHTELVTGEIANQVAALIGTKLDQLHVEGLAAAQGNLHTLSAAFEGFNTRLVNVEAATGSILTFTQASNDKLDGMEDTLGAFIASHTPAEATAG